MGMFILGNNAEFHVHKHKQTYTRTLPLLNLEGFIYKDFNYKVKFLRIFDSFIPRALHLLIHLFLDK